VSAKSSGKSWHSVAAEQPRRPGRGYPAVVPVANAVYVFGGLISGGEYTGTFSNAIQRISLPSRTARIVGHLPTPLAHAMAATVDGRIYVLGGLAPGGPSAAIRRFDPATSRLSIAGRLPRPRTDAAFATLGRVVYLLGGYLQPPSRKRHRRATAIGPVLSRSFISQRARRRRGVEKAGGACRGSAKTRHLRAESEPRASGGGWRH